MRLAVLLALSVLAHACDSSAPGGAVSAKPEPPRSAKPVASSTPTPPPAPSAPPPATVASASGAPSGSASGKGLLAKPIGSKFGEGGLGLSGIGEGGGCPCGCDRSIDMLAELRGAPKDDAARAVADALRTIGEREDGGYVTERMVQHRLRLTGLAKELGMRGEPRTVRAVRADATGSLDETKVRAEFVLHGEGTEIVRGEQKQLRACFLVRLDVENPKGESVTLVRPSIDAKVAMPVSRWYVAGTNGEPWDGVLGARERRTIHVVGYAGEPITPGLELALAVRAGSLRLERRVRAKKRWNDPS